MTGVEIIGQLLRAHAPLTAIVPLGAIKPDTMEGIPAPAILVNEISSVERQSLSRHDRVQLTERISVTVRARDGNQRRAIMAAVRSACSMQTMATMGNATGIAVTDAGRGPAIFIAANLFEQAQDFRVSFEVPR